MLLSEAVRDRIAVYTALLERWNQTVNLLSKRDMPSLWPRHIDDALQLIPLLPRPLRAAADFGSGAGFPGLIIAIVTGTPFHLIESDQRKASFLREAVRQTQATAVVHAARIEDTDVGAVDLVTARAVAPLTTLLGWAKPKLAPNGVCLFPKGGLHTDELIDAEREWSIRVEQFQSRTHPTSRILRISEIARVGSPKF